MVRERKGGIGFEPRGHFLKDPGEAIGEVLQSAVHIVVPGQFGVVPGRGRLKTPFSLARETTEPDITEVHQFSVLDVSKIWRVGENSVQTSGLNFSDGGVGASQINIPRLWLAHAVSVLANPLVPNKNLLLPAADMTNLKWVITIGLRLGILIENVGPPSASDARFFRSAWNA